jgi:hypothetical protein
MIQKNPNPILIQITPAVSEKIYFYLTYNEIEVELEYMLP